MYGEPGRFRRYYEQPMSDEGDGYGYDRGYSGRMDQPQSFSPNPPLPSMSMTAPDSGGGSGILGAVAERGQDAAADWMIDRGMEGVKAAKGWLSRPIATNAPSPPMSVGDMFAMPSMAGMPSDAMGFGQMMASPGGSTGVQVAQQALGAAPAISGAASTVAPMAAKAIPAVTGAGAAGAGAAAAGAAAPAIASGAAAAIPAAATTGAGAATMSGLGAALLAFL